MAAKVCKFQLSDRNRFCLARFCLNCFCLLCYIFYSFFTDWFHKICFIIGLFVGRAVIWCPIYPLTHCTFDVAHFTGELNIGPPPKKNKKDYIRQIEDDSDDVKGGRFMTCLIYCVDTPQSSEFLFFPVWHVGQWQKLLSSRPTSSQSDASLIVAVGGGAQGWGASLCCHREKCEKRGGTLNRIAFWAWLNCLQKFHEKSKGKAFYYNGKF
jgi:hypothetical protein